MAHRVPFVLVLKAFKADLDAVCLLAYPLEMFLFDTLFKTEQQLATPASRDSTSFIHHHTMNECKASHVIRLIFYDLVLW